jgi:mannose-6-phosphate isomerase-like protein (cupin superfamily)
VNDAGPAFRRAHVTELDSLPNELVEAEWKPVRGAFGIEAFGANAYVAREAGQLVVQRHVERKVGHQELYVVLAGEARFTIDGEQFDAPVGTLVFCEPRADRTAHANEPGTAVLAIGAAAGQRFEVSPWETERTPG